MAVSEALIGLFQNYLLIKKIKQIIVKSTLKSVPTFLRSAPVKKS
jgi:hypothetical protein